MGWVCDKAAAGTQTQAMFYGGAIFGGFLFGYIADRFGRQPALVICNCIGGIGGLLTAYSNSFWTFGISRFIVGFAYDNCYTLMYIIGNCSIHMSSYILLYTYQLNQLIF